MGSGLSKQTRRKEIRRVSGGGHRGGSPTGQAVIEPGQQVGTRCRKDSRAGQTATRPAGSVDAGRAGVEAFEQRGDFEWQTGLRSLVSSGPSRSVWVSLARLARRRSPRGRSCLRATPCAWRRVGSRRRPKPTRASRRFWASPSRRRRFGALRWRPPEAASSWPGVRGAAAFSQNCPQQLRRSLLPWTEEYMPRSGASEDCLALNVWSSRSSWPATGSSSSRPGTQRGWLTRVALGPHSGDAPRSPTTSRGSARVLAAAFLPGG
jgi:hypothetical protein